MAKTYCMDCGTIFEYESIMFGETDLGLTLAKYCDGCQAKREAADIERKREEQREANRQTVLRTLPPELLPVWLDPLGTDPNHKKFNRAKWETVSKWRPGPHGNWLGLIGGAGLCKTRCLALMAEKILMQGHRLLWTSAMRLFSEATYNRTSRDAPVRVAAREHLADCLTASFLVIDDLGNNEWSPAFESQLFTILDHRKNFRLPILYSSNVHPTAFHTSITSVNSAALIGRLIDRTNILDFSDKQLL